MLWKLQFDDEVMNIWRSYNRGVKNYMKEDYRSYIRNFWSCEKDSLKKKKKKKKRKNSGSYVIRYRCSALSIKPTGSRSLNWFVINPWKLRMMTKLWIYEKYICELRSEELYEERSSQFYTQILQLRKESLKKPEFFLQAFFSQLQKFVYIWFCFI